MSTTTFRTSLAVLGCIVLGVLGVMVARTVLGEHDGWSIIRPAEVDADPLIVEPQNLLTEKDQDSIRKVVEEARFYGIPWSVKVVSGDTVNATVATDALARTALDKAGIETSPGADDGLLMYVLIPEDDHTETSVAFATGDNFYPRGGLTPERLQWISDVQMAPMIEENAIGNAVFEGATWVEWTQLFRPAPDPPATNLEEGLRSILHPLGTLAVGLLALMTAVAAVVVARLTRSDQHSPTPEGELPLDPVLAAALAIGRVDHRSLAGVVLDAIDRGVIVDADGELSAAGLSASPTERDTVVVEAVERLEGAGVTVTPGRLARALRSTPLKTYIEDTLAEAGYLNARSYRFQLALRTITLAGVVIGAGALVLSVAGEVAPTLAVAILLTAMSVVVLIWNETRSWTTRAGQAAVNAWLNRHQDAGNRDWALFDAACHLDDVPAGNRGSAPASLRFQG